VGNGTSFATAIVTGMIAAEIARRGVSARDAWAVVRETLTSVEPGTIGPSEISVARGFQRLVTRPSLP
jgi:hypothetical protein